MRIVLYGLGKLTEKTAKKLIEDEHQVIIIDPDREKIEAANESLDCGFLVGEASYPNVLKEVNPENTDFFFALSESSQNNMVACLVARSLGIKRTILSVDDQDYQKVCQELGLKEMIVPSQITSQYLFDTISNENLLELFQFMKEKAALYKIVATEKEEGDVGQLNLASDTKVICYFRDGQFYHYEDEIQFKKNDEIVLLTSPKNMEALRKRWESESG